MAKNVTYLFDRVLHNVPNYSHRLTLSKPKNSSDSLALYRRVPLRLQKVNPARNRKVIYPENAYQKKSPRIDILA